MSYKILLAFGIFTILAGVLYPLMPARYRYISLLAASLSSIVWMSRWGALFLGITIAATWAAGLLMARSSARCRTEGLDKPARKLLKAKLKRKKQGIAAGCIGINLGILLVLKYFNFFSASCSALLNHLPCQTTPIVLEVALPLGISYYTLQSISYVVDVFRGKYPAERNIAKVALFLAFFPQLHEGPFGRYDALMPQLCQGQPIPLPQIYAGSGRILWGAFKIFMVANRAAILSDAIFGNAASYGGWVILLGGAAFTLQLYAEFSGYIDIASGIADIFGVNLAKNFDLPFLSQNVAAFWRKWHISLGAFFRDYVFYPVSTSKALGKLTKNRSLRTGGALSITISLLTVWLLTGLWHGASWKYICYGLYYFVLILLSQLLAPWIETVWTKTGIAKENRFLCGLRILKTNVLVLIGMILFRAENTSAFIRMMDSLFRAGDRFPWTEIMDRPDWTVLLVSVLVMIGSVVLPLVHIDIRQKYLVLKPFQQYLICFSLFCVIMIFGAYGLGYAPPDPIYGGF